MNEEDKSRIEEEERYRAQVRATLEQPKRKNRLGCGAWVIIVLVVIISIVVFTELFSRSTVGPYITAPEGNKVDSVTARLMCKRIIKEQLKAPRTAKFSNPHDGHDGLYMIGNSWRWNMLVDAENGFGALIRSKWTCTIDGDTGGVEATKIK